MRASDWIQEPVVSLLDVGCNAGVWLQECARRYPNAHLAGVDINKAALERIRSSVRADLGHAGAEKLPFPDASFGYVTCIEVLEHLPAELRTTAFREMYRVLRPGGRLILTVPHAGWFAWLDSNNVRLRVPRLYSWLVGRGRRDSNYDAMSRNVEWHHHFSEEEILALAGDHWKRVAVSRGGLFLYPLMDWLSWPFYRLGISHYKVRRLFERIAGWDYHIDFAKASYGLLIVLERERCLKLAVD